MHGVTVYSTCLVVAAVVCGWSCVFVVAIVCVWWPLHTYAATSGCSICRNFFRFWMVVYRVNTIIKTPGVFGRVLEECLSGSVRPRARV